MIHKVVLCKNYYNEDSPDEEITIYGIIEVEGTSLEEAQKKVENLMLWHEPETGGIVTLQTIDPRIEWEELPEGDWCYADFSFEVVYDVDHEDVVLEEGK